MPKTMFWVTEVGERDNEVVGKKCANLGEMARLGLQVPPCFLISIEACRKFMRETSATREIQEYIGDLGDLRDMAINDVEELSQDIRRKITSKEMPEEQMQEIRSYYSILCQKLNEPDAAVSVRSSGSESRPGMFTTYLNVKGEENLIERVKDVWASAFTTRAIAFRINRGIPIDSDRLGVAVVKMVNARAAGVSFSVDPVTGDSSRIMIEATWGLGEGVVKGTESVDRFIVDKETLNAKIEIGKKENHVVLREDGIAWEQVPLDKQEVACLSEEEVKEVARLTKFVEEKLSQPQDVEWAIEEGSPFPKNVYLLQTRPAKVGVAKTNSTSEKMGRDMVKIFKNIDISKMKVSRAEFKF